jgi:hypothetical protein
MDSKLVTANSWFSSISDKLGVKKMNFGIFRRTFLAKLRLRYKFPEPIDCFDNESEPVEAFVNKGMWIVMCLNCKGGAEFAWEEGYFFCCSCKNSYNGHRYRRLIFPADRQEIEDLLSVRPLENRNYRGPLHPNETLEVLRQENKDHASELITEGGGA